MNFNIQYPSLVEQAYNFAISRGIDLKKDEVYRTLVNSGMIDENGNATQKAIDAGLIEVSTNDPIKQFKTANPIMANIPDKHFKVKEDGTVLMDCYAVRTAANIVLKDPESTPEQCVNAQSLLDQVNNLDHNEWH